MQQRPCLIGLIAWSALLPPLMGMGAGAADSKPAQHRVRSQLDAAEFVAHAYPQASSIGLGIAIVPDPVVPRYRRPYDLSIHAIELGMLADHYVLDSYAFPWSRAVQQDDALSSANGSGSSVPPAPSAPPASASDELQRSAYGIMVFRCDAWRRDGCGYPGPDSGREAPARETHLRALYIVTDTATQGVAARQLRCAIDRIQSQLKPEGVAGRTIAIERCPQPSRAAVERTAAHPDGPAVSLLRLPDPLCPDPGASGTAPPLVILGPNFSGAMDSIGAVASDLPEARHLCIVSSAATDTTNELLAVRSPQVTYQSLALNDEWRMLHLARFARQAGFDFQGDPLPTQLRRRRNIAILAEASTFGYGVCTPSAAPSSMERQDSAAASLVGAFCRSAYKVYFPATIADIRYGVQQQQAQQSNSLAQATSQVQGNQHLSLQDGAEDGSEFPESQESALTSASDQLQLDRILGELIILAPRMVIVVATDVRDRLFLFDQLRRRLPRALLVDLAADNLMTHPDFLHATRGALAVASAQMMVRGGVTFGCEEAGESLKDMSIEPWSTDGQAILADTVARLNEGGDTPATPPCVVANPVRQAALQVVTFDGFRSVSEAFPALAAAPSSWWHNREPRWLTAGELYAPLLCALLPWLWLRPSGRHARVTAPSEVDWRGSAVRNGLLALCVPFAVISMAVGWHTTLQLSHTLLFAIGAVECAAAWAIWRCLRQIESTGTPPAAPGGLNLWWSAGLALLAIVLAVSPLIWSQTRVVASAIVDQAALVTLAFDARSGVAFFLVLALATVVVLATSAGVATGSWIASRHAQVMDSARVRTSGGDHLYRALPPGAALVATLLVALLAAPGFGDELGGARLTIFDPGASNMAMLGLAATTLCSALLFCAAIGVARRIGRLCSCVHYRVLQHRTAGTTTNDEVPGPWAADDGLPATFATTPVLARVAEAGARGARLTGTQLQQWIQDLAGLFVDGKTDNANRLALLVLLAGEMSLLRWAGAGAAICALASATIVYLYPIEADLLLLLNLVILAALGILCAYVATAFERNEVLSNVLCNRSRKLQVSTTFFAFIAAPFVLLAAAITITAIPGVVDWAGGVLAIISALGVHP